MDELGMHQQASDRICGDIFPLDVVLRIDN